MLRTHLTGLLALAVLTTAAAQDVPTDSADTIVNNAQSDYVPPVNRWQVSKERMDAVAREYKIYETYNVESYDEFRERYGDVADQFTELRDNSADIQRTELERKREQYHIGLGHDPRKQLFVAVSASMPEALIRAYAREAMWYGGRLVVRGIPAGMTVREWVEQYGRPIVENKTPSASIEINPVIFDTYDVNVVPTIIWDESEDSASQGCDGFDGDGRHTSLRKGINELVEVRTCLPKSDDLYFKVAGGVTVDWALEEFSDAGALYAQERAEQGRRYLSGNTSKEQALYDGNWEDELTPAGRAQITQAFDQEQKEDDWVPPYFETMD